MSKDALFHNEKESARAMARSKNYSRCENEPSLATCIASPLPHPPVNRRVLMACFPRGGAKHPRKDAKKTPDNHTTKIGGFWGEGRVTLGLI